jgi:hypothetical protein
MKHFILFLAIIPGAASLLFFMLAGEAASGAYWAYQLCTAAAVFCERPISLALLAGAMIVLWIMLLLLSSLAD